MLLDIEFLFRLYSQLHLWHLSVLDVIMTACSTFSDHGTVSILRHTRWAELPSVHILHLFSHPLQQCCVCGQSDSVLFPVDGEEKGREWEAGCSYTLSVWLHEKCIQWDCPISILYYTMTMPHGFMFHHYLLVFGMFLAPGVFSFLFPDLPFCKCSVLICALWKLIPVGMYYFLISKRKLAIFCWCLIVVLVNKRSGSGCFFSKHMFYIWIPSIVLFPTLWTLTNGKVMYLLLHWWLLKVSPAPGQIVGRL